MEKHKPTVYLACLAKQMQIRSKVMMDSTKLVDERPSMHGVSEKADFFTIMMDNDDEDKPFKDGDVHANRMLQVVG